MIMWQKKHSTGRGTRPNTILNAPLQSVKFAISVIKIEFIYCQIACVIYVERIFHTMESFLKVEFLQKFLES